MAVAAVAAGLFLAGGRALGGSEPVPGPERYRVRAGDTLWAIARREVGPEGDPRPLVADIQALNGMDTSALMAGQTLMVPGA